MGTPDPRYLLCVFLCATVQWPPSPSFLQSRLISCLCWFEETIDCDSCEDWNIRTHLTWAELSCSRQHRTLAPLPIFLWFQGSAAFKRMQRNYIYHHFCWIVDRPESVWKTTYQMGMRGSKSRYNSAVTTTNPKHTQPLVYYSAEPLDLRFILWQSDQPKMYGGRELVTGSCLLTILVFACLCFFFVISILCICVFCSFGCI